MCIIIKQFDIQTGMPNFDLPTVLNGVVGGARVVVVARVVVGARVVVVARVVVGARVAAGRVDFFCTK